MFLEVPTINPYISVTIPTLCTWLILVANKAPRHTLTLSTSHIIVLLRPSLMPQKRTKKKAYRITNKCLTIGLFMIGAYRYVIEFSSSFFNLIMNFDDTDLVIGGFDKIETVTSEAISPLINKRLNFCTAYPGLHPVSWWIWLINLSEEDVEMYNICIVLLIFLIFSSLQLPRSFHKKWRVISSKVKEICILPQRQNYLFPQSFNENPIIYLYSHSPNHH